jgi:hypothetical protein
MLCGFSENPAKLKIGSEIGKNLSRTHLMSGKLSSLERRLAKLERQLADRAWRAKPVNCNCRQATISDSRKPEEFEAEKNKPCPAHGIRRLGMIVRIEHMGRPQTREQLWADLQAGKPSVGGFVGKGIRRDLRLSQLRQVSIELNMTAKRQSAL